MDKTDKYISVKDIGKVCNLHEEEDIEIFEIVRCKDCKYHSYWCEELETRTPLDGYCWMGEREEDSENVVRCKDCKHRDPEDHRCDSGSLERAGCMFPVQDGYFCAWGERREDGNNDRN